MVFLTGYHEFLHDTQKQDIITMIQIPAHIITTYTAFIKRSGVLPGQHRYYSKWLRYYLDFCREYNFGQQEPESLAGFMDKLGKKRQAENLRKQARHAVSLFFEMAQVFSEKAHNVLPPLKNIQSEETSFDATYFHTK